jgi:hypothetical protein
MISLTRSFTSVPSLRHVVAHPPRLPASVLRKQEELLSRGSVLPSTSLVRGRPVPTEQPLGPLGVPYLGRTVAHKVAMVPTVPEGFRYNLTEQDLKPFPAKVVETMKLTQASQMEINKWRMQKASKIFIININLKIYNL